MDELKVGDSVTLKGPAEPIMVIEHLETKVGGVVASCIWFSEGKYYNQHYISVICLNKHK